MGALIGYVPILLQASLITLALAFFALLVATALGGLGAWGQLSRDPFARFYAGVYSSIVRGIPDLVLILLVYFGFQSLLNALTEPIGLGVISISAFWAGVISIGFIYGAYMAETFRGAYLAVPKGQGEAARALGLHKFTRFRKVVLPQLIRHALPGYGNVFQVLIKSTAIVGVIGLIDLVGIANDAGKSVREPLIFNLFVLVMYLVFYYLAAAVFAWLARVYGEKVHL